MTNPFQKAVKTHSYLRLGFAGPAGGGKTFTALRVGTAFVSGLPESMKGNGRIAFIDTEGGSAAKYADKFDFDQLVMDEFKPQALIPLMETAQQLGYPLLIIDSISPFWSGKEGILIQVDKATPIGKSAFFEGWKKLTPVYLDLISQILTVPMHLFITLRTKTGYVIDGKKPIKAGLEIIMRDGFDYELDFVGYMEHQVMSVNKTRIDALPPEYTEAKPGEALASKLLEWLGLGEGLSDKELFAAELNWLDWSAFRERLTAAFGIERDELIEMFATEYGPDWLKTMPSRKAEMWEFIESDVRESLENDDGTAD